MSVSDVLSSNTGNRYGNRITKQLRPALHKPKYIVNTHIKYDKLIIQKNFTSAELQLRKPLASVSFANLKQNKPSETASIASARHRLRYDDASLPLVRSSVRELRSIPMIKSAIQFKSKTTLDHLDFKSKSLESFKEKQGNKQTIEQETVDIFKRTKEDLLRLSYSNTGEIQVKRHVTSARLCDHLKSRGLGDPRDLKTQQSNVDPRYLMRKRRRQKDLYAYYDEKLKGRARLDMDTANTKAAAFIEQQKDAQKDEQKNARERHTYGHWGQQFRRVVGNEHDRMSDTDKHTFVHFAAWNEDKQRITMDDKFLVRINTWITQVQHALMKDTKS